MFYTATMKERNNQPCRVMFPKVPVHVEIPRASAIISHRFEMGIAMLHTQKPQQAFKLSNQTFWQCLFIGKAATCTELAL